MEKQAKHIIIYALAGILLIGIGAPIAQAAPNNRDQERQRQEASHTDKQREGRRHVEEQRRQDRRFYQPNSNVRRHEYTDDRYRSSNWRTETQYYDHKQPWNWHSSNHNGRVRINDNRWNQEFPGLHSFRWNGPGFWYRGHEYRDLVLFYNTGDSLVSVGFWVGGTFIMIRDDNRSYYNDNPFIREQRTSIFQINIHL
jgi:hypothetical protein